jgi:3-methylfumaryl-CoA hydratase
MSDALTVDAIAKYRTYLGRSEVRRQSLDAESLRRFAAAVGSSLDVEREPPPLAHWAYFLDCVSLAKIGADGHPSRDTGILPPIELPRRMFAASSITFKAPLQLNRQAELKIMLADVGHKTGKSGDLILIDVDRTLSQDGDIKIVERQTLVYADNRKSVPALPTPLLPAQSGQSSWIPSSVELLRFSAATFNAHRIHYDLPYALTEEGYPALVVHGPLTAAKLYAFANAHFAPPALPFTFRFRAFAPLFVDQAVQFVVQREDSRIDAMRCDGALAMSAWLGDSRVPR